MSPQNDNTGNTAYLVEVRRHENPALADEHLEELEQLVLTLDFTVAGKEVVTLRTPSPTYLVGTGTAERISKMAEGVGADVIVIDDELSPSQQRNFEKLSNMAVIDRREVILAIFAERAQTKEARLQVALARAEYSLPRLTRAWTHLERQRGGSGARGGAGELQLEVDRRIVQNQISRLKRELSTVRKRRTTQRKARVGVPIPSAALVGYTNAGKSSLLNALTGAGVLEEDKLFATLDPTSRRLTLPNQQPIILSDTVGFIRKLPHTLVEAFKATLEEATLATILLHVLDAANPAALEQRRATEEVLAELEIGEKTTILVLNKIDLVSDRSRLAELAEGYQRVAAVSTRTGEGLQQLKELIAELAGHDLMMVSVRLPASRSDLMSLIHRAGSVQKKEYVDESIAVEAIVPRRLARDLEPFM